MEGEPTESALAGRMRNSRPVSDSMRMCPRFDASLGELFAEQAARKPHATAVVDESSGTFLSYAEVDRMSDGIARALRAQRTTAGERVSLAKESRMGKLLVLLGILKAGISVPARYAAIIVWIGELVAGGRSRTLLLSRGVVLESSECTPACPVWGQRGREADRRSPRQGALRAARHLHVVDSAGRCQHIELVAPATAVSLTIRPQRPETRHTAALMDLGHVAGPVPGPLPRSQGPTFTAHAPSARVPNPRRVPVPTPSSDRTGVQPQGRASVPSHVSVPTRVCALTRAELAVARLVAEGKTNKEIADLLVLSVHTVGTHVRSSFAKLNVTNRVALAREIIFYDWAK